MKPKTFYILLLICSLSLFSSAKQAGSKCDKQNCCKFYEQKSGTKLSMKAPEKPSYGHSPLSLCLFSI